MEEKTDPASGILPTAVFIDYDSWFWSMYKYGLRPDISWMQKKLPDLGDILSITAFGVFRNRPELEGEKSRILLLTTNIVDCTDLYKEATDYAILDSMYRSAITCPDIAQYIVVTGDSHYCPTLEFLRHHLGKITGTIGVAGSMGSRLKQACNWHIEIAPQINMDIYREPLLQTMRWADSRGTIPTFARTVSNTASHHGYHKGALETCLRSMIEDGLICQRSARTINGGIVNGLFPDWEKINRLRIEDTLRKVS